MASQFSTDGKFFAQLSVDGKLKIWDTEKNKLEQEFTPDYHLTSPCICLHFIAPAASALRKNGPGRKKVKRKSSLEINNNPDILLGTTSGLLIYYATFKAKPDYTINSNTSLNIQALSWQEESIVYSAAEQHVLCWDLENRNIKSQWKAGNEKITSILKIMHQDNLLTASRNIKLWNITAKEVLNTFTGHSTEISVLVAVHPGQDDYFLSCSKGDRLISCWNLGGTKNAVANFVTEDIVVSVNVSVASEGSTRLAAVTRNGVCHYYNQTLNGKSSKPAKPKTTIQVVADSSNSGSVIPIPIVNAFIIDDLHLKIVHGNSLILTFENALLNTYEKVQCLVRDDPMKMVSKTQQNVTNVKTPIVNERVDYLTPQTMHAAGAKRKSGGKSGEVPMEQRLENLMLNKADDGSKVPKADNVAQLLLQGLHSKDKIMLRSALSKRDETVVKNTVRRLPIAVIVPLLQELTTFVQGKTLSCQIGLLWLKSVLQIHAGILASNPELCDILTPVLSSIEGRLRLQTPMCKLKGRLDLVMSQMTVKESSDDLDNEPLLVYNDRALSDSEMDVLEVTNPVESDNDWFEEDSEEDAEMDDIRENGDESSEDANESN